MLTPIVKLLRVMDGEKPVMGKIYDRMFMIGQKIDDRNFAWKSAAAKIYAVRWEYLHSLGDARGRLRARPGVHDDGLGHMDGGRRRTA